MCKILDKYANSNTTRLDCFYVTGILQFVLRLRLLLGCNKMRRITEILWRSLLLSMIVSHGISTLRLWLRNQALGLIQSDVGSLLLALFCFDSGTWLFCQWELGGWWAWLLALLNKPLLWLGNKPANAGGCNISRDDGTMLWKLNKAPIGSG